MKMAGPRTDGNGQIQRANPVDTLAKQLMGLKGSLTAALPRHMTPDRMLRVALTALRTTKDLGQCTPQSFLSCVVVLSQLGLEPNTPLGHAYLIPRRNGGSLECTSLIGYQGFIDLARRSGQLKSIYAHAVRAGDDFDYQLGLNPDLKHKPSADEQRTAKPITHVYAVAHIKDADPLFVVLTRAEIEARRARSAASNSPAWKNDYEAMARKSAIRALWPWLPKSAEMARADEIATVVEDHGKTIAAALDEQAQRVVESTGVVVEPPPEEVYDPTTGEVGGDQEPPQ